MMSGRIIIKIAFTIESYACDTHINKFTGFYTMKWYASVILSWIWNAHGRKLGDCKWRTFFGWNGIRITDRILVSPFPFFSSYIVFKILFCHSFLAFHLVFTPAQTMKDPGPSSNECATHYSASVSLVAHISNSTFRLAFDRTHCI